MPRRPLLCTVLAAWVACSTVRCAWRLAAFVPWSSPSLRPRGVVVRRPASLAENALETETKNTWQKGLDTAFLDVDSSLGERFAGLRELLSRPGDVASSLREAVLAVAKEGLSKGHIRALDALFPEGTLARSDLDGLLAVTRQVPEVMGDLYDRGGLTMPVVNASDVAPNLEQVRKTLQELLTPEGITGVADTAVDSLRKVPRGLQEPNYELFDTREGFDVRRYRDFTLATRRKSLPPAASGISAADPFSALAVHMLSGGEGSSINMTMPMHIEYDISDPEPMSVSFVMPRGTKATAGVQESDIDIVQVPEKLLAIRRFPGIATAAEVRRQYKALLESFDEEGVYTPRKPGLFSVFQYNPLYTIPWRRRNEIAIEVVYDSMNAEKVARAKAAARAAALTAAQAREEAEEADDDLVEAEVVGDP